MMPPRSIKPALLFWLNLMIVLATLALPSLAHASEWTKEGAPLEEDATITLEGSLEVFTKSGGWSCPNVTMDMVLTAGQVEGHITSIFAPSECHFSFFKKQYCGTEAGMDFVLTSPIAFDTAFNVPTAHLENFFHSEDCLFPLSLTFTVDQANETGYWNLEPDDSQFDTFTLSAELPSNLETTSFSLSGTFDVTPAGVYGVE